MPLVECNVQCEIFTKFHGSLPFKSHDLVIMQGNNVRISKRSPTAELECEE